LWGDSAQCEDSGVTEARQVRRIDRGVAHIARIYNYWLGGKDNFAADRAAAQVVIRCYPDIRGSVRAQREFLARTVTFLAAEAGIRQFLDIGTGLPAANNTHEVAQAIAPESRIVYVDNDPVVLTHARALLTSNPAGATAFLEADVRDPDAIVKAATATLDFRQPVALVMIGLLHCIPDSDDPARIVARLLAALPSGSYLALAHPASDIHPGQVVTAANRMNAFVRDPVTLRTRQQVAQFFTGTELIEPGLVQLHRWRAVPDDPAQEFANYGGVGRVPRGA
jgi:hypothetical protein